MIKLTDYPLLVFGFSFIALWLSARIGWSLLKRFRNLHEEIREDFGFILGATLTLLGLIIGFTFSMATTRYDMRKNYEEAEANAIGTEYFRCDLLPTADASNVRALLRNYLDQRICFYMPHDDQALRQINARTAQLQNELWTAILAPAEAHPTPVVALVISGMNDVLNSQGYTQAAYWNRIPIAAWALMSAIAVCCNLLVGYGSHSLTKGYNLFPILPLIVSTAFILIADIDAPRHGIIRVKPNNLISLAETLHPR